MTEKKLTSHSLVSTVSAKSNYCKLFSTDCSNNEGKQKENMTDLRVMCTRT